MSTTFDKVRALVQRTEVRISDHGYDEMSHENILAKEVLAGVFDGIVVEDYPEHMAKGHVCLYCKKISTRNRSTSSGEFRRIYRRRRLS